MESWSAKDGSKIDDREKRGRRVGVNLGSSY